MTMAWTYAQFLFLVSVALSIVFLVASEMVEPERQRPRFSLPAEGERAADGARRLPPAARNTCACKEDRCAAQNAKE